MFYALRPRHARCIFIARVSSWQQCMCSPASGPLALIQNVRLFFYMSHAQKKQSWKSNEQREKETRNCRATSGGAPRRALLLVGSASSPPPARDSQSNVRWVAPSRVPRAANTDNSRIPTRFDTTVSALVTSRALCWPVAFADVFSEILINWSVLPAYS